MTAVAGVSVATAAAGDVLIQLVWPVAVPIGMVDLTDVVAGGGPPVLAGLQVETAPDAAGPWVAFGAPVGAGVDPRTRRVALAPGQTRTARAWRVRALAGVAGRPVSIAALQFWRETAQASALRLLAFSFSDEQRYILAATDRNIEVLRDGVGVASLPIPHTSDQLGRVNITQSLDTALLFHPWQPPWRLFRMGAHGEWDARAATFASVPLYAFAGGIYTNGIDEVQSLRLTSTAAGDTFQLGFGDETTTTISVGANLAATAANVVAALKALDAIADDGLGSTTAGDTITLTFSGANGARAQPILAPAVRSGSGAIFAARVTAGREGGEPIMSASRGWPSCGAFYQQRLWLGGFASRPQTLIASVIGDYFNLSAVRRVDDEGIDITLDTNQVNAVRQLFPGRHLMIFTNRAEWAMLDRVVTPTGALGVTQMSRRGIQHWIPPVEHDGAVLFIQAGGQALREAVYSDAEQSYTTEAASTLASELVRAPVDMALRRAATRDDTDLLLIAEADGEATAVTLMRGEGVRAFARWQTAGRILCVGAEDGGAAYMAVGRGDPAAGVVRIERVNPDRLLDASVALAPGQTTVTGLDHLNGRDVALIIDGDAAGSVRVANGSIALPRAPVAGGEAGLGFTVLVETMPVKGDVGGSLIGRMKRIVKATIQYRRTGALSVGVNGRAPRPVRLRSGESFVLDTPTLDALQTGLVRLEGLTGWSREGTLVITQDAPMPLEVGAVALEVDVT